MGVSFYPVFEDGDSAGLDINGKYLARAIDLFDNACKKAATAKLYDFFTMSREQMIAEIFDGDPDDPSTFDESKIPAEHWHEATAGLKTVKVMLDFLSTSPSEVANIEGVRDDLEGFESSLTRAVERNVRWHLAIDY